MEGTYKYDDCIIDQVSYTYTTGNGDLNGPTLEVNVIGTGTPESTIAPNKPDGFTVNIPTPENITTIGDGLPAYIEQQLQQYRI